MAMELFVESPACSYMCFPLSPSKSGSYLNFFSRSSSYKDSCLPDRISDCINKAPYLHSSANIFVFGDSIAYRVKWLHQSNSTDLTGIQTLNFSIAQFLTQIEDFAGHFPSNFDGHAFLLDLFGFFSVCMWGVGVETGCLHSMPRKPNRLLSIISDRTSNY